MELRSGVPTFSRKAAKDVVKVVVSRPGVGPAHQLIERVVGVGVRGQRT
jgi:hypothetical protein